MKIKKISRSSLIKKLFLLMLVVTLNIASPARVFADTTQDTSQLTPIMGQTQSTREQMLKYFFNNNSSRTYDYVNNFVNIVLDEASAEGVRTDVAFTLMMKETNFLKFGGVVQEPQNNFGGLGVTGAIDPATGKPVTGESYPDIRTGIRAVVQHLQAYASTAPLNRTCVDTRYKYVTRGAAPYVEWLGINENPQHLGWASDINYGYSLVTMINTVKTITNTQLPASGAQITVPNNFVVGKTYTIQGKGYSSNKLLYQYWVYEFATDKWTKVQDYSESSVLSWTPSKTGKFRIQLYLKDIYSSNVYYDCFDYKDIIVNPSIAKNISLSLGVSSFFAGSNYTLQANAEAPNKALYQYWVYEFATDKWTKMQEYGENPILAWTPAKSGKYRIQVYTKDSSSENVYYDCYDYKDVTVGSVTAKSVSMTLGNSSFLVRNSYNIQSSVVTANKGMYQYWVYEFATDKWTMVQEYGENPKLAWTPVKSGKYRIQVYAKDSSSENVYYDCYDYKDVAVGSVTAKGVSMTLESSSFLVGNSYNIQSSVVTANRGLYQYWVYEFATDKWTMVQEYGENPKLAWTPVKSGKYRIQVYAKDSSSENVYYDCYDYKDVTVSSKTIVLDAGHGGTDPGAVANGYQEKDLNIQIVQKLGEKLSNLGFNVLYTRQPGNDVFVELAARVKFANDNNADLFISIHHDSSDSTTASGTSTHYSTFRPGIDNSGAYFDYGGKRYQVLYEKDGYLYYNDTDASGNIVTKSISINTVTAYDATPSDAAVKSASLAKTLVDQLSGLGVTSRGSIDHNLYVTRWTNMPSVLVEVGFVSNLSEITKISDPSYQDQIAQKITDSVNAFFNN